MEIFSHNYATGCGRAYAVTDEEYLQNSLEPPDRLTTRELNQLRAIRQEIESRPRITRFEKRYIRVLKDAEEEFASTRANQTKKVSYIRQRLKETAQNTHADRRSIQISFLIASIAKYANND